MQATTASSAVDLAEKYEYAALVRTVQLRPELAREVDDFGMTPLHWVCSDPRVPLRALQQLVLAHPRATTTTNLAGLLPLHIALRKNLPLDALKLLLQFYPTAITAPTPDGRTPLDLAADHVTAPSARVYLEMLDAEVRALDRVAAAAAAAKSKTSQTKLQQLRDACEPRDVVSTPSDRRRGSRTGSVWSDAASFHEPQPLSSSSAVADPIAECLNSPSMRAAVSPLCAPAWKLGKRCHVCACKFGYFKSRHHCRNCGESVCGRHSRETLPLRHLGLFQPQRVCVVCYEHLQNAAVGSHTTDRSGGAYSPTTVDGRDSSSSRRHSLFWSPEALSPRIFGVPPPPPPPKRTQSVRDYLLASPARRHQTPTLASSSPTAQSPAARSVRSEASETHHHHHYSQHGTYSGLPLFPSASSMFLSRVQLTPAPLQLVRQAKRDSGREREAANDSVRTRASRTRQQRRLVKTELDAPSKAWYEELDELAEPTPAGQKLSMDSRVSELEEHVHRLLVAKKQIGDALRKSQRQIHLARVEKDQYDAIAHKYLADGFAPCSPPLSPTPTRSVDVELAAALGYCADPMDNDDSNDNNDNDVGLARQEPVASSRTTASTSTSSRETTSESDAAFDSQRATLSDADVRPSSPLPTPRLSPFRSEQLDLPLPLDVAATHHELGVVLLGKCDFASAATAFRKSLDINATDAVAWFHLAKALDGAGALAAAEHAVNQSLALDAASLPSLSLLGRLLHLRGEHDEAIVVFRQALNLQCPPTRDDDDNDSDNRFSSVSSSAA